jgi:GH15 family glucan-1,4-alpha-glucosidase
VAPLPIESYGVIGDMHTVALVGVDGSIDWFCYPHFDSGAVFGALLDARKGGSFSIAPRVDEATHKQFYWPETNVLVTRFLCPQGVAEIIDYMPLRRPEGGDDPPRLVRRVSVIRGAMGFRVQCRPAFDFARQPHATELCEGGACFRSAGLSLALRTGVPLIVSPEGDGVVGAFSLGEGERACFFLGEADPGGGPSGWWPEEEEEEALLRATVEWWQRWLARCTYRGRWREMVQRSALVLKLLTFEPTGAIVAAPTCSLPEEIGGSRNWDYRYTWIRDAAFTLYALMRIGFSSEAAAFIGWLEARCTEMGPDGSLQLMYGIDGRHDLAEQVLGHLSGYRGSRPVRVGNGACNQLQLDIYGELMDSVYLYNKHGEPISYDLWNHLRRLVDWVCANWQLPDEGIWEVRGGRQHFVYSKVMCWVAIDRGLRLADKRSFPADRDRWLRCRDEIYEDIMSRGWSEKHGALMQAFGSETLDAANLVMPLVFFLAPSDPRMLRTLDAINRPPGDGGLVANSLVYRYNVLSSSDGLPGEDGTFNICTFWLVEALTRAGLSDPRRLEEARLVFERMLGYANHLGLFSEETGRSGEALGNFPQAFTHLALISAAFNLDRALGRPGPV